MYEHIYSYAANNSDVIYYGWAKSRNVNGHIQRF